MASLESASARATAVSIGIVNIICSCVPGGAGRCRRHDSLTSPSAPRGHHNVSAMLRGLNAPPANDARCPARPCVNLITALNRKMEEPSPWPGQRAAGPAGRLPPGLPRGPRARPGIPARPPQSGLQTNPSAGFSVIVRSPCCHLQVAAHPRSPRSPPPRTACSRRLAPLGVTFLRPAPPPPPQPLRAPRAPGSVGRSALLGC